MAKKSKEDGAANVDDLKDLSADDILSAQDMVIVPVAVPEWGGKIYVRTMSGRQKEKYIESVRKTIGKGRNATERIMLEESSAKLVVNCACDKNGKLIFTPAQVAKLAEKSSKALQRVVDAASELNGLSDEAEEDAKNGLENATVSDDLNTA